MTAPTPTPARCSDCKRPKWDGGKYLVDDVLCFADTRADDDILDCYRTAYERTSGRLRRLVEALGMDTPFPFRDVLVILADAVEHMRLVHDCDGHGHERRLNAQQAAREIVARLDALLADGDA